VRDSIAFDVRGNQQVGRFGYAGEPAFNVRAALWHDTPESFVDLSPPGSRRSEALATNGTQQVGLAVFAGSDERHAVLWSGTADSVIDLHQFLPNPERFVLSTAEDIDDAGNVYGWALEEGSPGGRFHAIVWQVVPEPSAAGVLALAAAGLLRRRPRTTKITGGGRDL
jgi:MYXO-CTERM domain-containing protein